MPFLDGVNAVNSGQVDHFLLAAWPVNLRGAGVGRVPDSEMDAQIV